MFKINSLKGVNYNINFTHKSPENKGNQTNPQITELSNVQADYAIRVPLSYSKVEEIELPYDIKAHVYKLENGQKVIIVPHDGETVVRTYVNTGSMNEPDNFRGISHYIEHNLFNGSEGIEDGDFFKQVNKMGASTNASTGLDQTNYYISSNNLDENDLNTKIKLHASMLESPLFAADKLLKEKDIVNSEINMITSDPQNIALNKTLKNLFGIKSASTDIIGGTTDNINNLTRQDVINYFNENYYPANMITVISGDVEPDEVMKTVSKCFTSKKAPNTKRHFEKLTPVEKQIREDIISDKAVAATSVIAFAGPKSADLKDRVCMDALMTILSNSPASRISSKVKEYGAIVLSEDEKMISDFDAQRAVIFVGQTTEDNSERLLKDIFNTIGNFADNKPTEAEMQIAKKILLKQFASMAENSFAVNDAVGCSLLDNNIDYIRDYEKIVNEITADDLAAAAKKYLDVNKSSTTVVHPATATKESINNNYKSVSFTGAIKKDAINMNDVAEYSYPNNYRLITVNSKTNNVDIKFKLKSDIDFKPNNACSLVLSELLNEGTLFKSEDDFKFELAKDGVIQTFSATDKGILSSVSCDTDSLSKGLQTVNEVLLAPRFNESDFEHAKEVVKNLILTEEKSAFDKLDNELFKGLPKGRTKEEILSDLETLSLNDVKTHYANILNNSQGIISVSAPFAKNDGLKNVISEKISEFMNVQPFKETELNESYLPQNEVKVLTDTDNKNQADIIAAYKFKKNQNLKDTVTLNLLNTILGGNSSSRLFNDLRENEKLAYMVKSGYTSVNDIGVVSLRILTTTDNKETGEKHFDNVQKSIDGFKRHVDKLINDKVTDDELNSAKLYLKNMILNKNHEAAGRASTLINSISTPYGLKRENMILNEIDNITAEDIYNAANYVFKNKPVYSILASEDTLDANREYLNGLAE